MCNVIRVDSGAVQSNGKRITLIVTKWKEDRNRQIVKSDSATIFIPTLDLELPPNTQLVGADTIEGMLSKTMNNMESSQEEWLKLGDVDNFHKCRRIISRLKRILAGAGDNCDDDSDVDSDEAETDGQEPTPFNIIIDDPAGNSSIQNLNAPHPDPNMTCQKYQRTPAQDMALGLQPLIEVKEAGMIDDSVSAHKNDDVGSSYSKNHDLKLEEEEHDVNNLSESQNRNRTNMMMNSLHDEVIEFPTTCPHCGAPTETKMRVTNIPHFKEIIIMCLNCEHCGFKSNEVKGGGAIPKHGTKITLHAKDIRDLKRELIKSNTAGVSIPELELELEEGGLDGIYTTVEGLLLKMHDKLSDILPFGMKDASAKQRSDNGGESHSAARPENMNYIVFLAQLKDAAMGKGFPFTFIITDPLSNSFVGPVLDASAALSLAGRECSMSYDALQDEGLEVEEYDRTEDQNENLGLNDMKTENYLAVTAPSAEQLHTT